MSQQVAPEVMQKWSDLFEQLTPAARLEVAIELACAVRPKQPAQELRPA